MNEKRKAFDAAIEACKAAMDVCDNLISIQVIRGYSKDEPCQVSILIDKDLDGLLRDVEPEKSEYYYHRAKEIGGIRVSMCNSYSQEVAYRERHGLPPLPPVEGQEAQETGK